MLRSFRTRGAVLATIGLVAVLLASQAGLGCGGDPYKSQAKGIIEDWTKAEQQLETTLEGEMAKLGGATEADIAVLEVMQPIVADIITAAAKAQSDLQGLTPPATAQAFHDDYLSGLQAFTDRAQGMSGLVDYLHSTFTVLAAVVPQEGDTGVWSEFASLGDVTVSVSNAADVAATLGKAAGLMQDAATQWKAISPPVGLAAAHEALGAGQQELADTFTGMAEPLLDYSDSGSASDLTGLKALWEQGRVQFEAFPGGVNTWFGEVSTMGDGLSGALNDIEKDLGALRGSLGGL
jgi:hypothetical protein